ncbi:MAG: Unknown protein [uncultured Sulfurovum sp.]|uniref:Uncharacterized protein n=1 Tax=uncultured Sulfurovum sp. TaxID=269237 RepID=A0A6S6S8D0_9BACT|nr:MAG: Unknown protein [uncultured Sulfurovum sp.]
MIDILIVNINEISQEDYENLFASLPPKMQVEVSRYTLKKDKQRTLAGKLLLLNYLTENTIFTLFDISKTSYQKPYIKNSNLSFNISHSGDYVVCACSKFNTIGIDIEDTSQQIEFNDFHEVLSGEEFQKILNATHSLKEFYRIWTGKEGVLKAEGKGLLGEIKEVELAKNTVFFKNKKYFIFSYSFNNYLLSMIYQNPKEIRVFKIIKKKKVLVETFKQKIV